MKNYGALKAYVAHACSHPTFRKAHRHQVAHFEAADAAEKQD